MATTSSTSTHAAARRAPALLAAPSQQLPPRPVTWGREATALLATGIAGYGAAPLLDRPGLAAPALGLGVFAGMTRGVNGVRAAARRELQDRLLEALAPGLGLRTLDRRAVKLSGWRRGWVGVPRRVDLRYAPGVDDTHPAWVPGLLAAVNRRLLADYQVHRHDSRRCRISLRWVPPLEQPQEKTAAQIRAERAVTELLGPTAVVTDVQTAGDELAAIEVKHEAATRLAAPGYRHRVERVVSTMLPGRWRAKWDLENDTVRFELRPTLPKQVPHPVPVLTDDTRLHIPLSVDEDNDTVSWHLRGTGPHLLVIGKTGQGKTVLMNGVVMELALRGWPVWICDPKRIEFLGMRDWPNVQIVATTVHHQIVTIYRAWDEMERRYELIESMQAVEDDFEPLILVLDEYRDFYGIASEWYAGIKVTGMPARCPVFEKVSSLVRKGRSARVHVVLGLQRPDSDILSGEMRDNFGTRISLGPLSPQGAMMMWESPHIGVSLPRNIAGRATAISDEARPLEVQAYWTPDPRRAAYAGHQPDLTLLDQLRPPQADHAPLQVQLDQELLDTPDRKGRTQEWTAVVLGELVPAPAGHTPVVPALPGLALPAASDKPQTAAAENLPPTDVDDVLRVDDVDELAGVDDVDDVDELEQDEQIPARQVSDGDLVLLQEVPEVWALVEASEADLQDEDMWCIDWRGDDDDAGSMHVPDQSLVTVRRWPRESAGDDRTPGSSERDWPWGG